MTNSALNKRADCYTFRCSYHRLVLEEWQCYDVPEETENVTSLDAEVPQTAQSLILLYTSVNQDAIGLLGALRGQLWPQIVG